MAIINKLKAYTKTTRFKTTIWYSSLFLILEIIIGLIIYFYLHQSMHRQLDLSLSKQADMIYNFVKESKINLSEFKPDSIYSTPDELVYDLIFEAVALNPRNTYIQVQLKDKTIFQTENLMGNNLGFPKIVSNKINFINFINSQLSPYVIRGAFLNKGDYKIIVAFPIDLIDTPLTSLTNIYIIIAPIFFLLSILGGAVLSSKSLSRIDSIIKKTDEITTQNLNEEIAGGEFEDEYGRLVRTMNNMIQRIKTSIDYMNQFSISASHELKTPLTILRGEIEVALKSDNTPDEYREIIKSNYEETLKLIRIVDKLFLISRIDHSLIKLKRINISTESFLQNIIHQLKSLGKEKNIILKLEIQSDSEINVDVELMRQVITNLIDNAIKYGNENEPVIVKAEDIENNTIKVSVINKGPGILKEYLPKIFDRFYRVDNSRSRTTGGSGLGLSIVNSIISMHNGEITVDSTPGDQTIFSVYLQKSEELVEG